MLCTAKLAQVGCLCLWVSHSLHLQIHVRPVLAFSRYKPSPQCITTGKYLNFFHFHSLGLDQFHNYFNAVLPVRRMETERFVTFFFFFLQSDLLSDGCAFGLKPLKKDVSSQRFSGRFNCRNACELMLILPLAETLFPFNKYSLK